MPPKDMATTATTWRPKEQTPTKQVAQTTTATPTKQVAQTTIAPANNCNVCQTTPTKVEPAPEIVPDAHWTEVLGLAFDAVLVLLLLVPQAAPINAMSTTAPPVHRARPGGMMEVLRFTMAKLGGPGGRRASG